MIYQSFGIQIVNSRRKTVTIKATTVIASTVDDTEPIFEYNCVVRETD